jgi:hypothetical protein
MNLNLKDVTLCAADCVTPDLASRAIAQSMARSDFGEAILFSDTPARGEGIRYERIERLTSRDDYSRFILKDLVNFVQTPFVLIVQWDGYVVAPDAWLPSFFDYDLIGAKWHWHKDGMTVGNGGFTLRSRKLLRAMSGADFPFVAQLNEDEQVCRHYRSRLEKEYGICFAPEPVADAFSYERSLPNAPTFGFHGLFNLWRHVDDSEMLSLSLQFSPGIVRSIEFAELLVQYLALRKFPVLRQLYALLKAQDSLEESGQRILKISNNPDFVRYFFKVCENLVQNTGPRVLIC